MRTSILLRLATLAVIMLAGLAVAGASQAAVDYSNKTLRIIVGFSPGGGYDFYGRLLGRHLPKYLEGNPNVVVQNMSGAGSAIAANFVYNKADADGTVVGLIDGGNAVLQLTGGEGAEFDLREFEYMGGFSENEVVVVKSDLPQTDAEGVFNASEPVKIGHFGAGSFHTTYVSILVEAMDSNARLVGGYGGASEVVPAIERGEVDGTALTYGTLLPHINRGLVTPVVMSGPRTAGLEDVSAAGEVAPTDRGKTLLGIMNGVLEARRIFVLPPGTPADVKDTLAVAYVRALKDPELLEEARRANRPTNYITSAEAKAIMLDALTQPPEIAQAFKDVLGR